MKNVIYVFMFLAAFTLANPILAQDMTSYDVVSLTENPTSMDLYELQMILESECECEEVMVGTDCKALASTLVTVMAIWIKMKDDLKEKIEATIVVLCETIKANKE